MKTKNNILWAIIAIAVIAIVVILPYNKRQAAIAPSTDNQTNSTNPPAEQPVATATFACDNNQKIDASFFAGVASTIPVVAGQPPIPTGSVDINLSDGTNMTLNQTISADGARYANTDGSIVFWNVGNKVTFTENGKSNYNNCVATQ